MVYYGMHVLPRDKEWAFHRWTKNLSKIFIYMRLDEVSGLVMNFIMILYICLQEDKSKKKILGCLCVQVIMLCTVHNHFLCHCWSHGCWSSIVQHYNLSVINDKSFPEFNLNPKSLHSNFNVICCIIRCTLENIISDLTELKCQ